MKRIEATRLKRSLLEAVITTIVLTFAVPCALAQTETWNGGTGNWNVAGNWTPNGVPNSPTTNVVITGTSGTPSSVTLNNLGTTIQNLSLDSFSTLISGGGYLAVAGSTITNAGQINVGVASTLYIESSTCTFSGGGTVNLGNNSSIQGLSSTPSLVNQDNMIQGQGTFGSLSSFINGGTVNANVSGGQLYVTLATNLNGSLVTNNGTLEATGGGQLVLGNVTNTNGTIFAGSSSSVYIVPYATIIGGNLTSASGGEIQGAVGATLQGVTITQGSTYSVYSGAWNALSGNLVNQGTVLMGGNGIGSTLYIESSTSTFAGGGTVNLSNNSSIQGLSSTQSLVNQDNTIQGQGSIGYLSSFINGGTVNANVSGGTLTIESAPTTNNGTFQVTEGSTLQVNTSFTTTGTVNIGALTDTSASLFQMAGGNDYVQTGGATSLWSAHSTLSAPTVNIEGGLLQGFGTIQGNLINSGTVHPGDGPGILTVMGNYTQNSGGILNIAIGGLTSGSQYSVLSVSGKASLSGMLEVNFANGFSPTVDDTFVILASSGLSGTFTDNTIQAGNVTFDVEYSPAGYKNDVVLLVAQVSSVPEPASLVMLTIGIAGVGVYVARRRGKTARA